MEEVLKDLTIQIYIEDVYFLHTDEEGNLELLEGVESDERPRWEDRSLWSINLFDEDSLQFLAVPQTLDDMATAHDAQTQRLALFWPHLHPAGAE
ncbi:hypothetical protein EYF80_024050 [Liparis tanakae]|uniref:Uncharacterized protein n=1 Tax=Liparis tanakae TaxID=230148 RepID=A0A4Z2HJ01_9TELE|nr:hypothetical protein EYF80_024050 [Liparis tanakae]